MPPGPLESSVRMTCFGQRNVTEVSVSFKSERLSTLSPLLALNICNVSDSGNSASLGLRARGTWRRVLG